MKHYLYLFIALQYLTFSNLIALDPCKKHLPEIENIQIIASEFVAKADRSGGYLFRSSFVFTPDEAVMMTFRSKYTYTEFSEAFRTFISNRERVDFGEFIGYYIPENDPSLKLPTNKGIIFYRKTGAHIIPSSPEGY